MAVATRSQEIPFLPPAWSALLKRMTRRGIGAGLVLVALVMAFALGSFDPRDPSLNTATSGAVENAMGRSGAIFADILMQLGGLAAWAVVITVLGWATRLMRDDELDWLWLRSLAALGAVLALSIPLEAIPVRGPVTAGLGGSAGEMLLSLAVIDRFQPVAVELQRVVAAVVGLTGGAFALSFASAIPLGAAGRGAAAFGRSLWLALRAPYDGLLWVKTRFFGKATLIERRDPKFGDDAAEPDAETPAAEKTAGAPALETKSETDTRKEPVVVARTKSAKPSKRDMAARQGSLLPATKKGFSLPSLDFLAMPTKESRIPQISNEALESNARMLESVLDDFGIKGQVVKVRPGPVVTLYELEPAPGTKTSRVVSLADDIARSMSAIAVRIAVIPGRSVIGIELPNSNRETVFLREMLASDEFERNDAKLILTLGKDIGGAPVFADLARMPHLLVAGTTGSGKSVAVNTMIMSLLYRNTPADVRFIMIDPKMLELSVYDGIPHLLAPVVTEPGKAVMALKWVVREMENRYRAMSQVGVRNVAGYNQRLTDAAKKGQKLTRTVQTGFEPETGKPTYEEQELDLTPLPFIVVIIDEMADLMLVAGKEVEAAVQRLAQMARAAGIHVVMATQRPSVDVITGTIKANFPTRISFQVTSKIDSRTILGEQGAEQLLGQGDMLYMAAGGRITRVHGPFVSDKEVERVVTALREQGEPDYVTEVTEESDMSDVPGFNGASVGGNTSGENTLFDQAVALVARERKASTSFIQRHLQIGYNRAARIIEDMEVQGMVGKPNHVGKREVLLPAPVDI
ncbi:MAG: cell division protein FtsK [Alphaproteobacteria bacterium]|nr:cell division protein FtsK [Alphaproteobacteria bacterium]